MNKKLFSTLFIIVILASFSAIGCKNPNTDPGTTVTGTDIGEKYSGTWYLNATPNWHFSPDAGIDSMLASAIIESFKQNPNFNKTIQNEQYIINKDGSILDGIPPLQITIEKNNISKEGDNKYIISISAPSDLPQDPNFTISAIREAYTFNADGQTATAESYIVINIMGKSYNLYVYEDGTFTKQN